MTPDTGRREANAAHADASAVQPSMNGARPTRAAEDELVEVRLVVNGTAVTLRLPPRITLADALRDHLGLTGTHLGCEHGVCGMCTVLVDGAAARSCLLFACQLDGAEVVTVEGLGSPGDLHPLQESFGRHHGLQCGFCTPGFLLSAYDLLTERPEVTEQELPEELSGVLCRCTGYRNILTAVADVARNHPAGIPPPRNCGKKSFLGHSSPTVPAASAPTSEPSAPLDTEPPPDIRLPQGEPTVAIEVTSNLEASVERVWRVLDNIDLLARCLPGAELTEDLGADRYRGRARVALGPVRLRFGGVAHVIERDRDGRRLRVVAQGEDASGGRAQADIRLSAEARGAGSQLDARAQVFLAGRIAQFGRSLADDVSRRMFEQFAESVNEAATSGGAPTDHHRTPNPLRMLAATLTRRLRRVARRRGKGAWQK